MFGVSTCQPVAMRLHPVIEDAGSVVSTVAESVGQRLSLRGELDVDVYRLHGTDTGPDLVARAFGPGVERATVDAAAHVLQALAGTRFPAERCPIADPVLALGEGRHLLVTEYVEPSPAPRPGFVLAWCVGLLGRLALRSAENLPAGGGWHRLGATPSSEIDQALALGGHVGASVAELVDTLADADDGTGLPEGLIHADLTPPNAVPQGDEPPVIIDWIGVGRGPRIWALAWLLYVAGPTGARRALDRYAGTVPLSEEERARLPAVMTTRPLTLDLWSVAHERMTAPQAVTRCRAHRARVESITAALSDSLQPRPRPQGRVVRTNEKLPSPPAGQFVTETLPFDGSRQVTAYVPPRPPEAIIYAGDGQQIAPWGDVLESADLPSTMIIGLHRLDDEVLRIREYSPGENTAGLTFDPARFAAHENFFVDDVRRWAQSRFNVNLPADRTAVFGVSAGGELALAMGLRHPEIYGTVLCASPGGGYRPPAVMPSSLPRTYLVAGTQEPFFLENATRWADALRDAGADVVMIERAGTHGGPFWREELPLMVAWAFAA
jgi:Phosphotransferase enzyme family/Putative esterase